MIAYLKGQILSVGLRSVLLLVDGVGYEVFVKNSTISQYKIGQESDFYIFSYIKEDAFDLYGFINHEELEFFKKLLSVSGVGPKSALNILGLAEVKELKRAISQGDFLFLQQVSGIGKKTAERLVVELKEKFIDEISSAGQTSSSSDKQVIDALISLGYKEREAIEAIKNSNSQDSDLATRLKDVLRAVSK